MCKVSRWNGKRRVPAEDLPWSQGGSLLPEVETAEDEVQEELPAELSGEDVSSWDETVDNVFCFCLAAVILLVLGLVTIIYLLPWLIES